MYEKIISLSFVAAALSFTVAETKLFALFRARVRTKNAFLGDLFSCGYCFGHWAALLLVAVYRPRLFLAWWPLDYFLTAIVIAWLAGFQWIALCRVMHRAGK